MSQQERSSSPNTPLQLGPGIRDTDVQTPEGGEELPLFDPNEFVASLQPGQVYNLYTCSACGTARPVQARTEESYRDWEEYRKESQEALDSHFGQGHKQVTISRLTIGEGETLEDAVKRYTEFPIEGSI